jgi:hypothetical protein
LKRVGNKQQKQRESSPKKKERKKKKREFQLCKADDAGDLSSTSRPYTQAQRARVYTREKEGKETTKSPVSPVTGRRESSSAESIEFKKPTERPSQH